MPNTKRSSPFLFFLEEHPEVADTIASFLEECPEVANIINGKDREDLDKKLKESGVEEESITTSMRIFLN
jgi:hypothetical protein